MEALGFRIMTTCGAIGMSSDDSDTLVHWLPGRKVVLKGTFEPSQLRALADWMQQHAAQAADSPGPMPPST